MRAAHSHLSIRTGSRKAPSPQWSRIARTIAAAVIELIENPLRDRPRVPPETDPAGPLGYHRRHRLRAHRLIDAPELAAAGGWPVSC